MSARSLTGVTGRFRFRRGLYAAGGGDARVVSAVVRALLEPVSQPAGENSTRLAVARETGSNSGVGEMGCLTCAGMTIGIRDVASGDLETVLALNKAAVPHVNSIPMAQMREFYDHAAYFRVALADGAVAAYLVGLTPDADYNSPNFQWFRKRYDDFAYVDRIAVAADARRLGLGSALYRDFERRFTGRVPRLACEVNLKPRNEPSLDFHRRHGFVQVGSQHVGGKLVAMLVKELQGQ